MGDVFNYIDGTQFEAGRCEAVVGVEKSTPPLTEGRHGNGHEYQHTEHHTFCEALFRLLLTLHVLMQVS